MTVDMVDIRKQKNEPSCFKKGEGRRENDEEANLIKIYFKYICKYHNVSPPTIIC
jgi:hypothetical protein